MVSTWGMRFGKFGVAGLAIIGFVFVLYLLGSTENERGPDVLKPPRENQTPPENLAESLNRAAASRDSKEISRIAGLLRNGPHAVESAREILFGSFRPRAKIEAIKVLENLATPEAITLLHEFAAHPPGPGEEWIHKNALAALARIEDPLAKQAVAGLRESGPPWVGSTLETINRLRGRKEASKQPPGKQAVSLKEPETPNSADRLDSSRLEDLSYLEKVAHESQDSVARRQALKVISKTAEGSPVLAYFVEKHHEDRGREWEVNTALREMILRADRGKESRIFAWIDSCDEAFCKRIVSAASLLEGPGPDGVLEAVKAAFPRPHILHLRADKALKDMNKDG